MKSSLASAFDALDELDEREKEKLNGILSEIVKRSIRRAVARLSTVPRLF